MVYQAEKAIKDFGEKVDAALIDKLKASKEELSQALAGEDIELITKKTEELTAALYEVTSKAYEQAAPEGDNPNDGVYDADFDIPDDNK
jgi:molecular chaperone DnaK